MNEPVRILEVVAKMNRAGTETMLMNFYRHMDRSCIQLDFAVCTDEKCDYEDEISSLGGKIYRYQRYTGKNHLQYKEWWERFFSEHKEYKIVHGHIGSTAAIYLGVAKKHGLFTIAHSHGTNEPLSLRAILYRSLSYRTRFVADQFFGCSMQALIDRYGESVAQSDKAKVLNNAIDAKKFAYDKNVRNEVRSELGISGDMLTLGTVGRLSPPKNPYMVLNILSALKEKGVDFRFIWCGVGELKGEIEKKIVEENLTDEVMMLGLRNDIPRMLQAMDIFVFPSTWEGLGIVAVEAQAAGLPTLCSDQVPLEAKVTELCKYISLASTEPWIKAIELEKNHNRQITTEEIIRNKYDINDQAKWLQEFYIAHCAR